MSNINNCSNPHDIYLFSGPFDLGSSFRSGLKRLLLLCRRSENLRKENFDFVTSNSRPLRAPRALRTDKIVESALATASSLNKGVSAGLQHPNRRCRKWEWPPSQVLVASWPGAGALLCPEANLGWPSLPAPSAFAGCLSRSWARGSSCARSAEGPFPSSNAPTAGRSSNKKGT